MHALDILGDPVRRRILELLVSGEKTSGAVVDVVNGEFGISQPADPFRAFRKIRREEALRHPKTG